MDWLSITCKTVESENELKLEEEIEKSLEENRQELFKLTGEEPIP